MDGIVLGSLEKKRTPRAHRDRRIRGARLRPPITFAKFRCSPPWRNLFHGGSVNYSFYRERDKGSFERRKDRPGDCPEDRPGDNDGDPRQYQTAREAISPVPRAPKRHPEERIFLPSRYFPFELSFLPIGRYLRGPFPLELAAGGGTFGIILLSDRPSVQKTQLRENKFLRSIN